MMLEIHTIVNCSENVLHNSIFLNLHQIGNKLDHAQEWLEIT